ncbi:MAG: hypothetical protein ACLSB9_08575 [Hydrogeniiclostridium mannosilyticum]
MVQSKRESVYDEQTGRGTLRRLYLRQAPGTGEVLACVVANGSRLKKEQLLVDCLRGGVPGLSGCSQYQPQRNQCRAGA